jgi:hypothetical protein
MGHADQLRVGPWVPEPGRHSGRSAADQPTAEYLLSRFDDRTTMVGGLSEWIDIGQYPDELDDSARRYRGSRRVVRRQQFLALIAALAVAGAVLLVVTMLPKHRGMHIAGGTGTTPGAATMTPVTYQADAPANTLFGTAHANAYPGATDGVVVRTLGNWGKGVGEGALRFNNVVVPEAGTYALTFYYVLPNNEPTRSVVITASGSMSVSLTVAGNATCCSAQMVRVDLNKGPNSITFSNPAGHAPAIDRIVVGPL